ncbi:alpha beta hydrolase [Bifidobacterium choerinum]|uniref:Alpha beta hydrolase n=1 Tax=Bifidobacterium choerinum TaxID=35760 RepID=A0A087AHJ4_9BIFI|nr:alpha beta hydrolase [Bifidobacterium choerinum]
MTVVSNESQHSELREPPLTAVVFDYFGALVDWRPERIVGMFYPDGVTAMFFDPDDPHGYDYYRRRAIEGWDDKRIIDAYSLEHGPAVGWIMRLLLENRTLGFYDMPEGVPTRLRELHRAGVRLYGFANCSGRAVDLMHAKYPWLSLLDGTIDGRLTPEETITAFELDPASTTFVTADPSRADALAHAGLTAGDTARFLAQTGKGRTGGFVGLA